LCVWWPPGAHVDPKRTTEAGKRSARVLRVCGLRGKTLRKKNENAGKKNPTETAGLESESGIEAETCFGLEKKSPGIFGDTGAILSNSAEFETPPTFHAAPGVVPAVV